MNDWIHENQIPETCLERSHRLRDAVVGSLLIGALLCVLIALSVIG